MKLTELAAIKPAKQAAKVFESYFGNRIKFDAITPKQARTLLTRVRGLVNEHRQRPEFHYSENNSAYLQLMLMEQVLTKKIRETSTVGMASTAGAQMNQNVAAAKMSPVNLTTAAGDDKKQAMNKQQDAKVQAAGDKAKAGQTLSADEQKLVAGQKVAQSAGAVPGTPGTALQMEMRRLRTMYRTLKESEIQQAQVVLAAQDMVDQIQKMLEQVTSMQFKDLPALCDQIKNQVGIQQSQQFNTDANGALSGLVQNLQAAKGQLDQALGVVTGQAPAEIPGVDMGQDAGELGMPGDELGGDLPPAPEGDLDIDIDADIEEPAPAKGSLGRARR
jgi:hypothetical protein